MPPVVIMLASSCVVPGAALSLTACKSVGSVHAFIATEHRMTRKSGRRNKLSEELAKADSMLWSRDSVVSKADLTHVKDGLWAVDTINPNC